MIGKSSEYAPRMKGNWNDKLRLDEKIKTTSLTFDVLQDKRSCVAGGVVANITTFLEACVHKKWDLMS